MNYIPMSMRAGRTYATASEAFKDADYATGLWKCETEWDRSKEYVGGFVAIATVLGFIYVLAYAPIGVLIEKIGTYV